MRTVDAEYKLEKNIKIAMLYLEDDDAVNAETFIKKAASLITGTKVMHVRNYSCPRQGHEHIRIVLLKHCIAVAICYHMPDRCMIPGAVLTASRSSHDVCCPASSFISSAPSLPG